MGKFFLFMKLVRKLFWKVRPKAVCLVHYKKNFQTLLLLLCTGRKIKNVIPEVDMKRQPKCNRKNLSFEDHDSIVHLTETGK